MFFLCLNFLSLLFSSVLFIILFLLLFFSLSLPPPSYLYHHPRSLSSTYFLSLFLLAINNILTLCTVLFSYLSSLCFSCLTSFFPRFLPPLTSIPVIFLMYASFFHRCTLFQSSAQLHLPFSCSSPSS